MYSMPWSVSLLAVFFCDCVVHKAFGKIKNALGLIFLWWCCSWRPRWGRGGRWVACICNGISGGTPPTPHCHHHPPTTPHPRQMEGNFLILTIRRCNSMEGWKRYIRFLILCSGPDWHQGKSVGHIDSARSGIDMSSSWFLHTHHASSYHHHLPHYNHHHYHHAFEKYCSAASTLRVEHVFVKGPSIK